MLIGGSINVFAAEGTAVYIPLRQAFEFLGAEVVWDSETGTIVVYHVEDALNFRMSSRNATRNGTGMMLQFPIEQQDGRALIALQDFNRLADEATGAVGQVGTALADGAVGTIGQLANVNIRNIIIMIPDGMESGAVTLARWVGAYDTATGEVDLNFRLNMDEIVSGKMRSYWTDGESIGPVADSAPAATTMASGHLTNNRFLGVLPDGVPVANVMQAARLDGRATGLVATSNIQHATPAGFSAHHIERNRYDIIGEQQVYGNFDVVLGAGLQFMMPPFRQDGEDMRESLVERGYQFVTTREEMNAVTSGRLWGIFAPHFLLNEIDRHLAPTQPSLAEMTAKAIELLDQHEEGFILMVEGSKVDWAAHGNEPIATVSEILAFDDAVGVALDFAKACGETLLLIAADHGTGGLTIGDFGTDANYHSLPVSHFVSLLARATGSFESIFLLTNEDRSNIPQLFSDLMGIDDLTEEEIASVVEVASNYVALRETVGPIVSRRINVGWTTGGHTGGDVTFYSFVPGDQRIVGLFSLADMALMVETAWNLDLAEVTSLLFNDAVAVFESRGATVDIDDSVVSAGVMTVTRGTDVLVVDENKDYVYFNDERIYFTLNVMSAGTFFVNQGVLELLP